MGLNIERIESLLLVAAVVAMLARRLRLPYTVGLLVAGGVLAFSPISSQLQLTRRLIFGAFLPPLIFEAAIHIPAKELRRDLAVVLTLATLGVLVSAAFTAAGMRVAADWQWSTAILFGALIAATDPVSVIATMKEAGVRGRLRVLTEAESLLNDGTAAVLFGLALAVSQAESFQALAVARSLLLTVAGGMACGALVAGALLVLAGRTTDHLVEITFTSVAAYGSFLLAEHFRMSGVLATLTAGLMTGNLGPLGAISPRGREAVDSFWEYVAFAANSLIFILIGVSEARVDFLRIARPAATAIIVVSLARALSVYGCCALFGRSSQKVDRRHQHILFWGGLRGALALALALGLPARMAHRAEVVSIAFAVVAFSIIVQGLTITPLMRRLGEIRTASAQDSG